jgi:carbamoyltransferase
VRVLGISAFYHDSAAALVDQGRLVGAAQEERFTRRRHDASFPLHAIRWVLADAGVGLSDLDFVVFNEKPFLKFERLVETYLAFAPRGFTSFRVAIPIWMREKLFQKQLLTAALREIDADFRRERLLFSEHHLSHAASAFYPSPFDEAAILTMDGVGEWATTTLGIGRGRSLELTHQIEFPHSLGMLYSAFAFYTGFKVNSGEYKLMGLAPYGEPKYASLIRDHLIELHSDGSYCLNLDYFDFCTGLSMTNQRFHELFGGAPRGSDEPLTDRHADLAASIQSVTEEAVLGLTRYAARETGLQNLCLAGGVALNCLANGRVLGDGRFRGLWIQPAAGDAGAAVGAALLSYYAVGGAERAPPGGVDAMRGALLGPSYSDAEIERRLTRLGARIRTFSERELIQHTAEQLAGGAAVGWFQGRMEFGPRALGARSILCDARRPDAQRTLNLKIKFRESFRPFAPSVLLDHTAQWFDLQSGSPYMLLVAEVAAGRRTPATREERRLGALGRARSEIPAATHVDGSARVQTVGSEAEPRFAALLTAFHQITGCPLLVNTSFNVRGEPIVCTPEDAYRCFMGTGIDALAIGRAFVDKSEQPSAGVSDHASRFEPD